MAAQYSRYGDYSTRYRFNGKEQDQATGFYYYGARYYEPSLSRWLSTDPLAEKYQGFSPYNYTLNNPINLVDPDGMKVETDFINIQTGTRTHIEDGKDQVLAINSSGMDYIQNLYDNDPDNYNNAVAGLASTNLNLHMTTSQFDDLVGTLYSEAGISPTWQEAGAMYGVLQNRANADDNTVQDQIKTNGVRGYKNRKQIFDVTAQQTRINSVQKGVAMAIVTGSDYSNGAYFWAGTDIATNSREKRQTGGLLFTSTSHDVMNVGSLKITGAPITGYWKDKNGNDTRNVRGIPYSYTYESTAGFGKTTFMKYTENFMTSEGNNNYP